MKLELDDAQIRATVVDAVLRSIDENKQQELIKGALAYLLKPGDDCRYGKKPPLEAIFDDACADVAKEICAQQLRDNPEIRERLNEVVLAVTNKIVDKSWPEACDKLADSLVHELTKRY